jgi:WD40 repeat protein
MNVGTGKEADLQEVDCLRGHTGWVYAVSFSPDGKLVASGSADKTIRIWHVETGKQATSPFRGHTGYVRTVAFSTDGKLVASGSDDKTVRIWDLGTQQEAKAPLKGHNGTVWCVVFWPCGKFLASWGSDNTVRIWDAGTGKQATRPLRGGDRTRLIGVAADMEDMAQNLRQGVFKQNQSGDYVVEADMDQAFIYSRSMDEPLAEYRAPANISSISCMTKHVCIGLVDGQVRSSHFSHECVLCMLQFHQKTLELQHAWLMQRKTLTKLQAFQVATQGHWSADIVQVLFLEAPLLLVPRS